MIDMEAVHRLFMWLGLAEAAQWSLAVAGLSLAALVMTVRHDESADQWR